MTLKSFLNSIVNSNNTGGGTNTNRTTSSTQNRVNHMFSLLNPSGHSTLLEDGIGTSCTNDESATSSSNSSTLSTTGHPSSHNHHRRRHILQQQEPPTNPGSSTNLENNSIVDASSSSHPPRGGGGGGEFDIGSGGSGGVGGIEDSHQELVLHQDSKKQKKGRKNRGSSSSSTTTNTRRGRSRSYDHLESVTSTSHHLDMTSSATALDLMSTQGNSLGHGANNMSSSSSSTPHMDRNLIEHDRRIQRQIEMESKKPKRVRVLVLGSGKSGKSTLIRKVKLIDGDYTAEQANEFKAKILKFVLNNAKYVIKNSATTELKDNIKRKNQLLHMWKFNNQNISSGSISTSSTTTTTGNNSSINNNNNSHSSRISSSLGETCPISQTRGLSPPSSSTPSNRDNDDEGQRITSTFLNPEAVELFKSLWRDKCVKSNFEQLCLNNSVLYNAKYFFDKIDTIASRKYLPSSKDILTTYIASNAIETIQLNYTFPCEFVDITGQRNERRKFIHSHFDKDSVSAIVFLVSLTEYCEYSFSLYPSSRDHDQDKNKTNHEPMDPLHFQPTQPKEDKHILSSNMQNSLSLFKEIVTYYNDMPIILLFTKLDIFKRRIKRVPLNVCFPDFDYSGDHVFLYTSFIADKFINVDPTLRQRCLYTHFVDLVNEDTAQMVLDDIKDIILQKTLRDHGLF
ncbi:hypothetical protein C9374_007155 [Naegleria lovaniensis]|uniref:Uncharacterized protein n=1 Tax=Naegleria lovaniensis TaxID=51637 RepID=A0AA88KSF1_NAELO|nr:uncharacterized protein C9374_007155 [Naegleria lovaniensis]KAG2393624.1 hypothetical protein C9374_007155 [Naegleria lovaniensis]